MTEAIIFTVGGAFMLALSMMAFVYFFKNKKKEQYLRKAVRFKIAERGRKIFELLLEKVISNSEQGDRGDEIKSIQYEIISARKTNDDVIVHYICGVDSLINSKFGVNAQKKDKLLESMYRLSDYMQESQFFGSNEIIDMLSNSHEEFEKVYEEAKKAIDS